MKKTRIELNMSILDCVQALAEGNPGAISVLMRLYNEGDKIDPDSAFGGFGTWLSLDTHGIYGPRIWMLYKDVCGQDLATTIAMLRACQLGILAESTLDHAIDNYGKGVDVPTICAKVQEQLPNFKIAAAS